MENPLMTKDKQDFWKDRFFRNPKTVIFDLDGTLCDVEHRRKYVTTEPKNWEAFNKACVLDKPNRHVLELYKALVDSEEYNILFFSGRSNDYREETLNWLRTYAGGYFDFDSRLMMRKSGDTRHDVIVKTEMLELIRSLGADVRFAVDDRNSVVKTWRDNGVPCFQCAEGDF